MNTKKKKAKWLIIPAILILSVLILFAVFAFSMKSQMNALAFDSVDLNLVQNGTYTGTAETSLVKVKVQVTVTDHVINDIQLLKHQNGKGAPAESILDSIINQNTPQVDSVSGATCSSVVIKAAVNEALKKGIVAN